MLFTKKHSPGLSRRMFAYCAGLTLALVQVSAFSASLLDALKLAEASDPVYQEAQATALAVAEGIPQAQALLWLPHLDLTSGISYNSQRISTGSGFSNTGDTGFRNYDYSLNIVQPVYHADRKIRLEQANKRLQQAQTQLDAAHQALMLRVAERYFDVLAALERKTESRNGLRTLKLISRCRILIGGLWKASSVMVSKRSNFIVPSSLSSVAMRRNASFISPIK